ncbi:MAG: hypothetical protein HYT36_01890 [Candidatus Staskawiczbacteria bacterium]|nr:hypothetical protein [Candidatus Staskawiczbacteria bacterium]
MGQENKNIIVLWMGWHFYEMPKFLIQVWNNYLLFESNFFSIPLLLKTFFSPWRRYGWRYPNIMQVGDFFNTLVSNTFSRIIGILFRIILIAGGMAGWVAIVVVGFIAIVFWILMPFILMAGLLFIFTF